MPAQGRSSAGRSPAHSDDVSAGSLSNRNNEYITVCLSDIRKEMQCPICLGIIRKTRTVMECLHRFCRECIDKSMRLGRNNECPACRTHCASRRSLRDDPNFDALIAVLYPDIDKYEEEEMALLDEETRRNKQIQASIAETFRRQSEAVARRRTTAKATAAAIVRKAHGNFRSIQGRNRGRGRGRTALQRRELRDMDGESDYLPEPQSERTSSLEESHGAQGQKRIRVTSAETSTNESESEENSDAETVPVFDEARHSAGESPSREGNEASPATDGASEGMVTWARACARSQKRYGSTTIGNSRQVRSLPASVLIDTLNAASCKDIEEDYNVHFKLQPFEGQSDEEQHRLPQLEKPHLCCSAKVTIEHILKFLQNHVSPEAFGELEILAERLDDQLEGFSGKGPLRHKGKSCSIRPDGDKIAEVLTIKSTLGNIYNSYWSKQNNLVLLYRRKN
ncbi:hypothetical protein O6H91_03G113400 [Diphasiastrum complanatum]|uniref:Uncharacterized protein n=1 Tax=Diphasiastrum complanatum TaxID=34168 RepID=A0ACC2EAK4_DIPCM|nr:hypothetical protein O6H91_03G113400 [Diphasiastrum complanatum]